MPDGSRVSLWTAESWASCPACGQGAGRPCRTRHGGIASFPHGSRVATAPSAAEMAARREAAVNA